ncbi:MAG TPA: hypothetical protein PL009_01990 [Flavipsychrobacter sp.]|nr:hypothetical protein [Flavipsychrobacter sp.]
MSQNKKGMPISHLNFDLKNMSVDEMKSMFMNVSMRSLGSWLTYYQGKEQYEICQIIKDIYDYKSGKPY